jgi:hypothetical protein
MSNMTGLERLRCGRCHTRMNLVSTTPKPDHSEKRIFECAKCHFIETQVIADPLTSADITNLTNCIWPPSQ